MKWAFSTNAFINCSIIEAICKIADAGYQGVEILMDHPLLWPFDITPKQINEIKQVLKARRLSISNLNAFTCCYYWLEKDRSKKLSKRPPGQKFGPCFCDYEEEYRQQRIDYTKKVIDLAVKLGAKDISTCSGYRPLRGTREMAWENMVGGLKQVVKYAEKKGVRINIEPEPGLLVGGALEVIQIVKDINSPNFGINFDIGHLFVSDGDIIKVIKRFAREIPNKIHSVHIEDIGLDQKGRPVHYHLIPGRGVLPLKEILRALRDINYQGWYTVELYTYFKRPISAARQSIKYIKYLEKELSLL